MQCVSNEHLVARCHDLLHPIMAEALATGSDDVREHLVEPWLHTRACDHDSIVYGAAPEGDIAALEKMRCAHHLVKRITTSGPGSARLVACDDIEAMLPIGPLADRILVQDSLFESVRASRRLRWVHHDDMEMLSTEFAISSHHIIDDVEGETDSFFNEIHCHEGASLET